MATLRQLEIFVITADCKKMSLAAKQLFISQSSISQIISELENEYGVTLFERQSRELKITEAGKLLKERAIKILNLNDSIVIDMKNFRSVRPLRIGATTPIGPTILGKLIKEFNDKYPDIDVSVKIDNTANIEAQLLQNELDVALLDGIVQSPTIKTEMIFEDNLCLICGKNSPFFGRDRVSISELSNVPFILQERGNGTRTIFESIMHRFQIDYRVRWESISTGAVVNAVINDFGIGIISTREASILSRYEIHAFRLVEHELNRNFYTATSANRLVNSQILDWCKFIKSLPKDYQ